MAFRTFLLHACLLSLLTTPSTHSLKGASNIRALAAEYSLSYEPIDRSGYTFGVRVMDYNVQQLNVAGTIKSDQGRRLKKLTEALKEAISVDVVVLNELMTEKSLKYVRKRLSRSFPYRTEVIGKKCSIYNINGPEVEMRSISGDCSNTPHVIRGGVAILSRHPIAEAHGYVFRASQRGTWDYHSNKGAVLAKIMIKGHGSAKRHPVWVVGTHLQANEGEKDGNSVRQRQARELTAWIDDGIRKGLFHIRADEPVIIAGDLNVKFKSRPSAKAYRRITKKLKLQVNYTAEDARAGVGSYSAKTNWMAKYMSREGDEWLGFDDTLDYIGYRTDFRLPIYAPAMKVLPLKANKAWYWKPMEGYWNLPVPGRPTFHQKTWNKGYYRDIADHYPVMADFYF